VKLEFLGTYWSKVSGRHMHKNSENKASNKADHHALQLFSHALQNAIFAHNVMLSDSEHIVHVIINEVSKEGSRCFIYEH